MKLIAQIAAGILLAGIVSTLLWLGILNAAVSTIPAIPTKTIDMSHVITERGLFPAPQAGTRRRLLAPSCENFIEKANGERHCLENAPIAEIRIERNTPAQPPHSAQP